ncbi:unnamed protein product [Blepharisma stoltei]|uniref:Uncharacterized protein n=1 Tax=Blepharisma stoltei TaxID=1481888 RepID=A0AAU9JLZ3_9CILI|nr:unnamed protein product [Blepharisma stoltei]
MNILQESLEENLQGKKVTVFPPQKKKCLNWKVRRAIYRCLREERFEEIDDILEGTRSIDVEKFYENECHSLLDLVFNTYKSCRPLEYLIKIIPSRNLSETLKSKNYNMLEALVNTAKLFSRVSEEGGVFKNKLRALVKIKDPEICGYIMKELPDLLLGKK